MQRNTLTLLASIAHLFPARKVSTSAVSALRFTCPSRLMRPRFEATRSGKHLPFGPRETWENKLPCLPPFQWITSEGGAWGLNRKTPFLDVIPFEAKDGLIKEKKQTFKYSFHSRLQRQMQRQTKP